MLLFAKRFQMNGSKLEKTVRVMNVIMNMGVYYFTLPLVFMSHWKKWNKPERKREKGGTGLQIKYEAGCATLVLCNKLSCAKKKNFDESRHVCWRDITLSGRKITLLDDRRMVVRLFVCQSLNALVTKIFALKKWVKWIILNCFSHFYLIIIHRKLSFINISQATLLHTFIVKTKNNLCKMYMV